MERSKVIELTTSPTCKSAKVGKVLDTKSVILVLIERKNGNPSFTRLTPDEARRLADELTSAADFVEKE